MEIHPKRGYCNKTAQNYRKKCLFVVAVDVIASNLKGNVWLFSNTDNTVVGFCIDQKCGKSDFKTLTHQGGCDILLSTLQSHPQWTIIFLITAIQICSFLTKSVYHGLQVTLDCKLKWCFVLFGSK